MVEGDKHEKPGVLSSTQFSHQLYHLVCKLLSQSGLSFLRCKTKSNSGLTILQLSSIFKGIWEVTVFSGLTSISPCLLPKRHLQALAKKDYGVLVLGGTL